MFTIRCKDDLRIAYEILYDRKGRVPSTLRNDEKIAEWKRAIRNYLKNQPVSEKVLVTDADIIEFLEGKPRATTIKAALREYMENHKGE